jgi:class 3 adenylate cyclase/tetratricopeptide (TPR) repeat protein
VFLDLVDSTAITGELDPEAHRRVQSRFFEELRIVLERHGGTLEKFIGDAVMAVFGIPSVHEDDALRAVRAATEVREVLFALNAELRTTWDIDLSVRIGINTGEVVAGDPTTGQRLVTGDAINLASRLETAASRGEILMGQDTYRLVENAVLVEPVERLELKGLPAPVDAWRVLGVLAGAPSVARRLDSPLVGRDRELRVLAEAFDRVAVDEVSQLVTVLGPAGSGKSRLATELLNDLKERATILVGRCLPYGDGITFWPVVEIVKRAAHLGAAIPREESLERLRTVVREEPDSEAIVERLSGLLGLSEEQHDTKEIFWAVRKLLEALARTRAVVVVFDDVHWAEQTFLDLIDHVAEGARDFPILLLCIARPELLEERPSWGGGKLNATSLLLEPLDDEAATQLIDNLLEHTKLTAPVKEKIARAAEGNPLFLEQMLATLTEDGEFDVPPTIHALLAARIGRLDGDERRLLERAAVAGRIFSRRAVRVLSDETDDPDLDEWLEKLVRKQLIRPHRSEFSASDTYRFRHSLIREVAYREMSKTSRAELHERFAHWLAGTGESRSAEQDEILGFHLEQAHRYGSDVGSSQERLRELAGRASARLASAGHRAFDRGDMPGAVGLLTRATLLLEDDVTRARLAPMLGNALIELGELMQANAILSRAGKAAAAAGDPVLEARTKTARLPAQLRLSSGPRSEDAMRVAEEALAVFEEAGDELGLAEAWRRMGDVHWMGSRWQARADALEQALIHARRAGDRREEADIMASLGLSLLRGPVPASEGLDRFDQLLAEVTDDPVLKAHVIGDRAALEAMLGRFDEARGDYLRCVAIFRDRGLKRALGAQTIVLAEIEILAGDPEAAEREVRLGCEIAEETGNRGSLATLGSVLAEALYLQGRFAEAKTFVDSSAQAAPPDDIESHILWRAVGAKLFARSGRSDEAERLAHEAIALADETDGLTVHAGALMSLAEVRRMTAGDAAAVGALEAAVGLYERKENLVAARRAKGLLTELVA